MNPQPQSVETEHRTAVVQRKAGWGRGCHHLNVHSGHISVADWQADWQHHQHRKCERENRGGSVVVRVAGSVCVLWSRTGSRCPGVAGRPGPAEHTRVGVTVSRVPTVWLSSALLRTVIPARKGLTAVSNNIDVWADNARVTSDRMCASPKNIFLW